MGELLHEIERLSDANTLSQLLTYLQQHDEVLIKHLPQLDELLPVLSPRRNTLGMIYILCVLCRLASCERP